MLLERHRLGELLVLKGQLTPHELRIALSQQKAQGAHLGRILVENQMISRRALYKTLAEQTTMRCMIAALGMFLTVSSFGIKPARAGSIKDVPAQMRLASTANTAFTPVKSYPPLFGSEERASTNLEPFTKWTGMFKRFDAAMDQPNGKKVISAWQRQISNYQSLPLEQMAKRVNAYINDQKYILDNRNYGQSDYWSTPIEFFERGGDCEDFAIAKYVSLRALGVPEERLRVAIVHDLKKDIPHAVLVVYTDSGALILDNQNERVENAAQVTRYKPIFTINRNAWWLHTKPSATVLASR
ncbi:MAG: transglutaminase-like cysteine peptidase [Rhodospirillales bacterium]|nr:transglutaminase-like cysteine peptidase [Rhodospirillales bacterium]MCB9997228.1 transglutaminase-like cysteine peptidase [Rhodospirillales bacterium]